jgi:hypothetical protein
VAKTARFRENARIAARAAQGTGTVLAPKEPRTHGLLFCLFWCVIVLTNYNKDAVDAEVLRGSRYVANRVFALDFRIWRCSRWKITYNEDYNSYSVDKYRHFTLQSVAPGWRIWLMFARMGMFLNNGTFFFIANCLFGPFGLRSLFGLQDFQPDQTADADTGRLVPTGPVFSTLFGRVAHLWSRIRASRASFEAAPDRGLLSKSVVRPFNLAWNYVCKV